MEAFLIFVFVIIGIALFNSGFSAVAKAVGVGGMSPLQIRLIDRRVDENDIESPLIKEIQGEGLFPLKAKTKVGFITSVFDETSGNLEPVISALEAFQEAESIVYQHKVEVGYVGPDQGFRSWVRLGVIIPTIIQPPYGGERKLKVILRMIDLDNPPPVTHGFHHDHPGLLWQQSLSFSWNFAEKGFSEIAEHRDESLAIALKIGMAVAMADGHLDDKEGLILKQWIKKAIEPFADDEREKLKNLYNTAMKEAYKDLTRGELNLSTLTKRLNEIGEKTSKYEALELCFDVMSADGVADKNEMRIIQSVSEALELDLNEIEKMRDQQIINLNSNVSEHDSIEALLGIQEDWTHEKTQLHLRNEFQKWNNRLSVLSEGEERENAQKMLNLIAEARKKYA